MARENLYVGLWRALAGLVGAFLSKGRTQSDPRPLWLSLAEHEVGFHEIGANHGIARYLAPAKTGNDGDPWCAIFANAMLECSSVRGTRSAMARSFENDEHFVRLSGPALGCIVTMWRGSPGDGRGHVFFYTGHDDHGAVWGIGGNEDDGVRKAPHDPRRIVGYFWPASLPLPKTGRVYIHDNGNVSDKEV